MTELADRVSSLKLATASEFAEGLLALAGYGYGFRGESDSSFALVSSLRRRMNHIKQEDRRRIEQKIISSFSLAAGDQVSTGCTTGDILALMQHHGAPTRMIDFSYSPFVGLYFLSQSLSSPPGRLYVVDSGVAQADWLAEVHRRGRDGRSYEVLPVHGAFRDAQEHNLLIQLEAATNLPLVYQPAFANSRMRSQSGFFLVESLVEPWIEQMEDGGVVASIEVPQSLKHDLLQIALQTNNGGATLFPGLDGIGREIVERFLVDSPNSPFA